MKIRTDFVANSSSSSFVINKNYITKEQIDFFENFQTNCKKYEDLDQWDIEIKEDKIYGFTVMNNFDIIYLFKELDLSFKAVESIEND